MEISTRIQPNSALRSSAGQSAGEQNTSTQTPVKPATSAQAGSADIARQTLQSALSLLQPVRPHQTTLLAQLAAAIPKTEASTKLQGLLEPWHAQLVRPEALTRQSLSALLASINHFGKQSPIPGSPGAILPIIDQLFRGQHKAPASEQLQRLLASHGLSGADPGVSAKHASNSLTNQLLLAAQQQFGTLLVKRLMVIAKRTGDAQGGVAQTPVMDVDIPIAMGQHIGLANLQINYRQQDGSSANTAKGDKAGGQKLWQFSLRLKLPKGANFQADCTLEQQNVSLVLKTDRASLLPVLKKQVAQLTQSLSESGFVVMQHSCSKFDINEQPPPCPTIDITT